MVVDLESGETQFRRDLVTAEKSYSSFCRQEAEKFWLSKDGEGRNAGDMVVREVPIRPGQQEGYP